MNGNRGASDCVAGSRGGGERGAGTVLAVALLGAIAIACGAVLLAVPVLAAEHRVQNAADAAALAAADTLSGRDSGYPCANAERAAALDGASLVACSSDGLIARVIAHRTWASFELTAQARAGPPGSR